MKVTSVEEQEHCTMLYIDGDNGEKIAHAIPIGVLEARAGEWDLPADVDPLDVVLVECHHTNGALSNLSPFDENYEASRAKLISETKKHRGKTKWANGLTKEEVLSKCLLPDVIGKDIRDHAHHRAKHHRENPPSIQGPAQLHAERIKKAEEMVAGYQRRTEELLADEFVSALDPSLRKAPKRDDSVGNPDAAVRLAIQFVP